MQQRPGPISNAGKKVRFIFAMLVTCGVTNRCEVATAEGGRRCVWRAAYARSMGATRWARAEGDER